MSPVPVPCYRKNPKQYHTDASRFIEGLMTLDISKRFSPRGDVMKHPWCQVGGMGVLAQGRG